MLMLRGSNHHDGLRYNSSFNKNHGQVCPCLLQLKHLRHLDLSSNYFYGTRIPSFIGSLSKLRYLNLSRNDGFGGIIPHQLGNLSELRYLDLSQYKRGLVAHSLHWLSGLSYLQYLDMSYIELRQADDVFNAVNEIPHLKVLRLSDCDLHRIPVTSSLDEQYRNLTSSLETLDISWNNFEPQSLPGWIFNISSLVYVDLTMNGFQGSISGFGNLSSLQVLNLRDNSFNSSIPTSFGNLCSLHTLDLGGNHIQGDAASMLTEIFSGGCAIYSLQSLGLELNLLTGELPALLGDFINLETLHLDNNLLSGLIPYWIGKLSSLKNLNLSNNRFEGTIPPSLGMLSELIVLDLRFNSLGGFVSDSHIENMTKLEELYLSSNSLAIRMSSDWIPPFQLKKMHLRSCDLGPKFPVWLRKQTAVYSMDMSSASITGTVPGWFWNSYSSSSVTVEYLNISNNGLSGTIPVSVEISNIFMLDLSNNQFHGPLPRVGHGVGFLQLDNNYFSGDLLPVFNNNDTMTASSSLAVVILARNLVSGSIPESICRMRVILLDLSSNLLSGQIPHCSYDDPIASNADNSISLFDVNLANNNLSGVIPPWIGSLTYLGILYLNNNSLQGEIPSLKNCSGLKVLNLGENKLRGNIPKWIGESMLDLRILRLHSNSLKGIVPQQLSHLSKLQILDLADNNLSGNVPPWIGKLTAMALANQTIDDFLGTHYGTIGSVYWTPTHKDSVLVTTKGMGRDYSKTLSLVLSLDLSSNNLSGDIPQELTSLLGLQNLNLSNNHLKGAIPESIGVMCQLQSLDLSGNQLDGAIPTSINSLTFLSYLNLSNNNLSGRIPSGRQIQTLIDPSIYTGNRDLCGSPLPKKCPGDHGTAEAPTSAATQDGENKIPDNFWYYFGAVFGFVVGFWTVLGPLLLNQSWRVSYYKAIDNMFNYCRFWN